MILDPKTSKRIFQLARDQQDELEVPDDEDVNENEFTRPRAGDPESSDEEEADEEYEGFLDLDQEEHELVCPMCFLVLSSPLTPFAANRRRR